jgi:hypothetical protein
VGVLLGVLLVALLAGCGGDESAGPEAAPDQPPRIAGVYDTAVELTNSTCDGIEVMDNPTTIEQTGHSTSITLTHAGTTWQGTIGADDVFFTGPQSVEVGADTHQISIQGLAEDDGFEARVSATVTGARTCTYEVTWVGSRQQ